MIRDAHPEDADAIRAIYNPFIQNSVITFEEEPISERDMRERIRTVTADLPWLVWEEEGRILGYAYASRWQGRCAYRYTVESSIYLSSDSVGKGLGRTLYTELLQRLTEESLHSVIAGIALPNPASIALHEKLGFVKAGQFREVGRKFDRWIDVGYWELLLERGDPISRETP
ncbi:MAG: arsinothricin resistance N-acetyltransferase ArsN1 family B [Verrucomicrobiota bacterium]